MTQRLACGTFSVLLVCIISACSGDVVTSEPAQIISGSNETTSTANPTTTAAPGPPDPNIEDCLDLFNALRDATGDALVELVRRADLECISELEWVSDPPLQIAVSREENVTTVAEAIPKLMANYGGSSEDGIGTLFLFLAQTKDIHLWCLTERSCQGSEWDAAASYSTAPGSQAYLAVRAAIDSFVEQPAPLGASDEHVSTWHQVLRAMSEYEMGDIYLHVVTQWMNDWNDRYDSHFDTQAAMRQVLDLVYDGHRQADFGAAFSKDRDLIRAFADFVLSSRWLGTNSQWVMERSALELGRYTMYKGTANYDEVVSILRSIAEAYENDDRYKPIWLRLIAEIDYNDAENCERYDVCDWYTGAGFNTNFRNSLFDDKLECPTAAGPEESIVIYAQDLAPNQLELACQRLYEVGQAFQSICGPNCQPVLGDYNDRLEVFLFNDGRSCEDMESAAFGDTPDSCSGIYWEGDPSDPQTTAQLVMTEYTPDESPPDPALSIWNFEHEYTHYLDGRYNWHGPYRGDDPSIHWWSEGFAEYLAAETSPYIGLPEFESPYSLTDILLYSGSIPTGYEHRHLAVRYLLENQREFVDTLLGFMRRGAYDEYRTHMANEAPKHEAEWQSWLSSGPAPTP